MTVGKLSRKIVIMKWLFVVLWRWRIKVKSEVKDVLLPELISILTSLCSRYWVQIQQEDLSPDLASALYSELPEAHWLRLLPPGHRC